MIIIQLTIRNLQILNRNEVKDMNNYFSYMKMILKLYLRTIVYYMMNWILLNDRHTVYTDGFGTKSFELFKAKDDFSIGP